MSKKSNLHRIEVSLTDEEYNLLLAQKEFLGIPTYAKLIRMYIRTGICYKIDYTGIHEIASQISRVGNNINQIAAVANESKNLSSAAINEVMKYQKQILDLLDSKLMNETKLHRFLDDISISPAKKDGTDGWTDGGTHYGSHKNH